MGKTDGWFDDPIGLSARAYILIPPIALGKFPLAQPYTKNLGSNLYPTPELTCCYPIGYYSTLPSHTLTPHSGTSMSLRSTLMRHLLIGRLNHGVVFTLVLFLL